MKVETDAHWNGELALKIIGESCHENTLLELLAQREFGYKALDQMGSTDGPTATFRITFKAAKSKTIEALRGITQAAASEVPCTDDDIPF